MAKCYDCKHRGIRITVVSTSLRWHCEYWSEIATKQFAKYINDNWMVEDFITSPCEMPTLEVNADVEHNCHHFEERL